LTWNFYAGVPGLQCTDTPELGTGGVGAERLQAPVVGGAGRRGGNGAGEEASVAEHAQVSGAVGGGSGCATDVGARSGRAHTWGTYSRAVVRSGPMHGGPTVQRWRGRVDDRAVARSGGRPGGSEVGRTSRR
jgi:hypothetical protein